MIKKESKLSKINKYLTKNKISINEIQKFLRKKNFNLIRENNNEIKSLGSLLRTFISSLIIILVFFISPKINEFQKQRVLFSKDFENNSKNKLEKVLDNVNVNKLSKVDEGLSEKYLFEDVLQFEDLPNDVVRLSANTIQQLFKDIERPLQGEIL